MAEYLSEKGIPMLLMDIKGDLSGLAQPSPDHRKIDERHEVIGLPFEAKKFPIEVLTISEQDGVRLRVTISEFRPVLLSKNLDFQKCKVELFLLFLNIVMTINLHCLILKASIGAILRKIIEIDQ